MKSNGMKVNTKKGKTEFVVISRRREEYDIYMNQNRINQSDSYCHLGVYIGERNLLETEINNRIAKFNRNVGRMYQMVKDRYIPRECKLIYRTILKPILTYGSEMWTMTTKTELKLQAAEMKLLRLIKRVTRRDRIRNTVIRSEFNMVPLIEDIERGRLRWYGHVRRMEGEKKQKNTWNGSLLENRQSAALEGDGLNV